MPAFPECVVFFASADASTHGDGTRNAHSLKLWAIEPVHRFPITSNVMKFSK
jgi:hypothetical protein